MNASAQKLPLPKVIRTSDTRTRAVEYAALPELLPQVLSWIRSAGYSPGSEHDALVRTAEALFVNAAHHARGPVRLVLIQHSPHRVDLAVRDCGPKHAATPHPDPKPGGGLATVEAITESWGWYGDSRGHTVWARIPTSGTAPQEETP